MAHAQVHLIHCQEADVLKAMNCHGELKGHHRVHGRNNARPSSKGSTLPASGMHAQSGGSGDNSSFFTAGNRRFNASATSALNGHSSGGGGYVPHASHTPAPKARHGYQSNSAPAPKDAYAGWDVPPGQADASWTASAPEQVSGAGWDSSSPPQQAAGSAWTDEGPPKQAAGGGGGWDEGAVSSSFPAAAPQPLSSAPFYSGPKGRVAAPTPFPNSAPAGACLAVVALWFLYLGLSSTSAAAIPMLVLLLSRNTSGRVQLRSTVTLARTEV